MATRADNHEGSCKLIATGLKKGKWRVQYTFVDEMGRKKRLSRLFDRQTEGKDFLKGLKREERVEALVKSRSAKSCWMRPELRVLIRSWRFTFQVC